MVGALLLMCACVQLAQPTAPAADVSLSAPTATAEAVPLPAASDMPLARPQRTAGLADEPITSTLSTGDDAPPPAASADTADDIPSAADVQIQIAKSVDLVPGQTTLYTLTLHNQGPGPATGIVVTDLLPMGLRPVWTQPGQPACGRQTGGVECDLGNLQKGYTATLTLDVSIAGTETATPGSQQPGLVLDLSGGTCTIGQDPTHPQVTCHLSSLQAGGEARMRIGVDVDAPLTESLVHTVTVTANEPDPDLSNNLAMAAMILGAGKEPGKASALPGAADLVVQAIGPQSVIAGQPFTYTYAITNQGGLEAAGVRFEDAIPPDLELVALAPGMPHCEQQGDILNCTLHDPASLEAVTVTLVITGHGGEPVLMGLDPLAPGWPICSVVKERTFLHIVNCELGTLRPGQEARVRLVLVPVGVQERSTSNTVSVTATDADLNPSDNTITTTLAVQTGAGGDE
jgi:uncharacterized repeat protein (TIGR01451 family)